MEFKPRDKSPEEIAEIEAQKELDDRLNTIIALGEKDTPRLQALILDGQLRSADALERIADALEDLIDMQNAKKKNARG